MSLLDALETICQDAVELSVDQVRRYPDGDEITDALKQLIAAHDLLRSLNGWDALNPPSVAPYGDAPWFKSELERVLRG